MSLATTLTALMAESGLSQAEAARALGCGEPYLSRVLNGIYQPPMPLLRDLSRVLGCDPATVVSAWQSAGLLRVDALAREMRLALHNEPARGKVRGGRKQT